MRVCAFSNYEDARALAAQKTGSIIEHDGAQVPQNPDKRTDNKRTGSDAFLPPPPSPKRRPKLMPLYIPPSAKPRYGS
jgi:hypothetical protein